MFFYKFTRFVETLCAKILVFHDEPIVFVVKIKW